MSKGPPLHTLLDDGDPDDLFELIEELAQGSYGNVFRAIYKPRMQTCALKIIALEEDETFDDLKVEIALLKQCDHSNIVSYIGGWKKGEELFIAMELVDGGSLDRFIELRGKGLEEAHLRSISVDALHGLKYMHDMGVIHRDIKSANILMNTEGHVKLVDFGVSVFMEHGQKRMTFIGSPYWMAPEVIDNRTLPSPYDTKADVWSFGVTLLELAHNRVPLSELQPMVALRQIPRRDAPYLEDPTAWSEPMQDFVRRCLAKFPDERATVDELLAHPWLTPGVDRAGLVALSTSYLRQLEALEAESSSDDDDDTMSDATTGTIGSTPPLSEATPSTNMVMALSAVGEVSSSGGGGGVAMPPPLEEAPPPPLPDFPGGQSAQPDDAAPPLPTQPPPKPKHAHGARGGNDLDVTAKKIEQDDGLTPEEKATLLARLQRSKSHNRPMSIRRTARNRDEFIQRVRDEAMQKKAMQEAKKQQLVQQKERSGLEKRQRSEASELQGTWMARQSKQEGRDRKTVDKVVSAARSERAALTKAGESGLKAMRKEQDAALARHQKEAKARDEAVRKTQSTVQKRRRKALTDAQKKHKKLKIVKRELSRAHKEHLGQQEAMQAQHTVTLGQVLQWHAVQAEGELRRHHLLEQFGLRIPGSHIGLVRHTQQLQSQYLLQAEQERVRFDQEANYLTQLRAMEVRHLDEMQALEKEQQVANHTMESEQQEKEQGKMRKLKIRRQKEEQKRELKAYLRQLKAEAKAASGTMRKQLKSATDSKRKAKVAEQAEAYQAFLTQLDASQREEEEQLRDYHADQKERVAEYHDRQREKLLRDHHAAEQADLEAWDARRSEAYLAHRSTLFATLLVRLHAETDLVLACQSEERKAYHAHVQQLQDLQMAHSGGATVEVVSPEQAGRLDEAQAAQRNAVQARQKAIMARLYHGAYDAEFDGAVAQIWNLLENSTEALEPNNLEAVAAMVSQVLPNVHRVNSTPEELKTERDVLEQRQQQELDTVKHQAEHESVMLRTAHADLLTQMLQRQGTVVETLMASQAQEEEALMASFQAAVEALPRK